MSVVGVATVKVAVATLSTYGVLAITDTNDSIAIGLAPTLAVLVTFWLNRKKINEVHVLVNNRLDQALTEIESLKTEKAELKTELKEK
jgi:mannose/fructose/N-acetylgalactosamine-specific phosphotransferase system component IID